MAQQIYHRNAKTNEHVRLFFQENPEKQTKSELATRFNVSNNTVYEWQIRADTKDRSSRPHHINYSLSEVEKSLIVSIRSNTWLPLDEIYEMMMAGNPSISRSSVYRTCRTHKINNVPEEKKEQAKKFKAYKPGYLHIDVSYLPKLEGKKQYLFVAIDRATRFMYYTIYEHKTAENAQKFLNECIDFFPFVINYVLTDNGLEFTNRLIISKKGDPCKKPSKMDETCAENNIEHRLTKPSTPQTNGMVERVNGTIKNNTILRNQYQTLNQMDDDLMAFLVYYNLYRRHGSLRKELHVKTPFDAIEKWYQLEPELFTTKPSDFKTKILNLSPQNDQLSTTTL